ncbi:MAG: hypothetical protein II903_07755 [Spirochaetales bacterium]|nr:hypothetical protein [Spirochaetales bacterium]
MDSKENKDLSFEDLRKVTGGLAEADSDGKKWKEKKEPKEDPKNGIPSLAEAPAVFEKAALEDIILEQAEIIIH